MKTLGENSGTTENHANPPKLAGQLRVWVLSAWNSPGSRLRLGMGIISIFILVLAVYRPMLPGMFLMDDHRLVAEDNPLVDGEFTLWNIWFQTDFILSNIAFWVQWLAWGNHPGGYHAVNLVLHALSAVVLWRLLARLKVPGAWVAAALFAVHPVAVTSVARIAELKNTLSLPFFLASFWAYLRFEEVAGSGSSFRQSWLIRAWYVLSILAFGLALLSKTSTIMLPVVLLFWMVWQRGKAARFDVWRLTPFFLMSLVFGVMSAWFQKYQALGGEPLPYRSVAEKLAVAGKTIWFYLGKDYIPWNLNAFYPVWKINAASPAAYLSFLLLGLVLAAGWRFRRDWGSHLLFGLGCFLATLFPVLGFFEAQYLTWFQVSDHLQYLPMLAPVALAVAGLSCLPGRKTFQFTAVLLIASFALLAFQRARIFSNEESLMRDCLAKNPAAWGAQNSLGTFLAKKGDLAGAVENFETALKYKPDDAVVHLNLGHALALQGKFAEAEPHFLVALERKPIDPEIHRQFGSALRMQGRDRDAINHFQTALSLKPDLQTRMDVAGLLYKKGDFQKTVNQLRLVVAAKPDHSEALNNLAWLLATCADDNLRDGREAVRCAEKACALTEYKQAGPVGTLAAAYAEAGRFPEAVKTCQLTVNLATAAGQPGFTAVNNQLLKLYQIGKPYHAAPAGSKPSS